MTKELKGSKTEQNLNAALCGESIARNKYTYYASQARKDGYEEIAKIFEQTANNEKEHAKIWFKLLHGGKIASTVENLKDAAASEHYEWTDMYINFAKEAREEGFDDIAFLFENVAKIEKHHDARYSKLIENVEKSTMFEKNQKVLWECGKCGYGVECEKAPEKCPVCSHPKAFFFERCEKF